MSCSACGASLTTLPVHFGGELFCSMPCAATVTYRPTGESVTAITGVCRTHRADGTTYNHTVLVRFADGTTARVNPASVG